MKLPTAQSSVESSATRQRVPGKSIARNRNLQSNQTSDRFNFVKSFRRVAVEAGLAEKKPIYIYG